MVCAEDLGVASQTQEFDDSLLLDSAWIQFLRPALKVLKEEDQSRKLWNFDDPEFVK